MHSLRHGGAAELALANMGIELVAKRGRWARLASASRYIQMGIAMSASIRMPPEAAAHAARLAAQWAF